MSVSAAHHEAIEERLISLTRQRVWAFVSAYNLEGFARIQQISIVGELDGLIGDTWHSLFHPEVPLGEDPNYPMNPVGDIPMLEQVHYLSVEDRLTTLTRERVQSMVRCHGLQGDEWRQELRVSQNLGSDIADAWDMLFRFPEPVLEVNSTGELLEV